MEKLMPTQRPLPAVIGLTENALRALLTKVLSTTTIKTYSAWVVLNAAANAAPSSTTWQQSAADALKVTVADIDTCLAELQASGLLSYDGSQTPLGISDLAQARSAVATVTAKLVEGIGENEQQIAGTVLEQVRSRADALLQL
jgi:hypothetical protein